MFWLLCWRHQKKNLQKDFKKIHLSDVDISCWSCYTSLRNHLILKVLPSISTHRCPVPSPPSRFGRDPCIWNLVEFGWIGKSLSFSTNRGPCLSSDMKHRGVFTRNCPHRNLHEKNARVGFFFSQSLLPGTNLALQNSGAKNSLCHWA